MPLSGAALQKRVEQMYYKQKYRGTNRKPCCFPARRCRMRKPAAASATGGKKGRGWRNFMKVVSGVTPFAVAAMKRRYGGAFY